MSRNIDNYLDGLAEHISNALNSKEAELESAYQNKQKELENIHREVLEEATEQRKLLETEFTRKNTELEQAYKQKQLRLLQVELKNKENKSGALETQHQKERSVKPTLSHNDDEPRQGEGYIFPKLVFNTKSTLDTQPNWWGKSENSSLSNQHTTIGDAVIVISKYIALFTATSLIVLYMLSKI